MSGEQMCLKCRNAIWDYVEAFYGRRWWFVEGCHKDLEPTYNEEEETYECEGYKNDSIRTE